MRLAKNEAITLDNGEKYIVESFLGEGGQGEVYLVSNKSEKAALKIYKNEETSDFKYNLRNNINRGSPSKSFLWPRKYVETDNGNFGYIMDIRPKNYVSFVSYLNGQTLFKSLQTKLKWCTELCRSFKTLHENGYSYQDLNDGSFFLNPDTGELLICDNDNVTADKKNLGILGKMRYMAPEIVRGDINPNTGEAQLPDIHSDRFSLAVILFLAMCLGNPFEGERLKNYDIIDEESEREMFGTNPVFIYNKTDKSNRPIRGYHDIVIKSWSRLPIYIKEAFHRTFVDGLHDRENERTTELEWLKLISRYRNEVVVCDGCGKEYIWGLSEQKMNDTCPCCGRKTKNCLILHIGKSNIVLDVGKEIYLTDFDKYSSEYNKEVGQVISNRNKPDLWGIRINGIGDVTLMDSEGKSRVVTDGGVIPIIKNLKIKLNNNMIGEID